MHAEPDTSTDMLGADVDEYGRTPDPNPPAVKPTRNRISTLRTEPDMTVMAQPRKRWTPDVVRQRIRVGAILHRLHVHVLSPQPTMHPSQIRAAEILLRKALPDLTSTEHTGTVTHRAARELSRDELLALVARASAAQDRARATDAEPAPSTGAELHVPEPERISYTDSAAPEPATDADTDAQP